MRSLLNSKSLTFSRILSGLAIVVTAGLFVLPSFLVAQSGRKSDKAPQSTANSITESQVDAMAAVTGQDSPPSMQAQVAVIVELNAPPAAVPYAAALKTAQAQADAARAVALKNPKLKTSQAVLANKNPVQISAAAARQVSATVRQLDQAQRTLLPNLTTPNIGGKVIYRVQRAYNGIAMYVAPGKIAEIAKLPGVKAVHPIHLKYPTAFTDIDFLGTRSIWTTPAVFGGARGELVKVGVIDSGLDYVHTNFGGPGTPAAYAAVTDAGPFPNAFMDPSKVGGGYDFAGDAYNGGNSPTPDGNPYDGDPTLGASAGHGTACASLVAGYGVNANGTTYAGPWAGAGSPDISPMKISPGFAPKAVLYPLRVFGNSGGTNLVSEAIDWAIDPNGDGNFSDHLDVISLSLGSNEGYPDDDSAIACANAASIGMLVCAAAGNGGDSYYMHSSPAAAPGILSVAASFNDQGGFIYDATITPNTNAGPGSPPDGKYKAIYGSASPHVGLGGLTGNVVYAVPNNGSNGTISVPLTNPVQVAGNICLIDRGVTTFTDKIQRCFDAGAVAVIVNNFTFPGTDPIPMATTGQPAIPAVMISRTDRDTIVAAAGTFDGTGLPTNSPVNVTLNSENGAFVHATTATDTMPYYSARGPRMGDSALKPDITAPAEVTGVATVRSGSGVQGFNGTSSATPHVAGAMALLRQMHPTWSTEELNALACNTATHELTTGPSPVPLPTPVPSPGMTYGVGRVGAGRIDLAKASQANVVAYNQTNPGLINVSFGVVEVPADGSASLTKTITVANKSAASVTYNLSYQDIVAAAGTGFTLPASITVGPGSTGSFDVTFTATGSALRHERDQSITLTQATVGGGNLSRSWMTEKAGYVKLTPTGGPEPEIRVALYAAPKPTSAIHATISGHVPTAPSGIGSFNINLSGLSMNTGATYPTDIISLGKAFELQYASSASAPTDPNVIKYVGVTSDWVNRTPAERAAGTPIVTFGIEGFGDASVPEFNSSDKEILIDFDFDDVFDAVIYVSSRTHGTTGTSHTNVYRPVYVDIAGYFGPPNTGYFLGTQVNCISPASRDVNVFNNSMVIIPVAGVGLVATGFSSFNYLVATFDRNGDQVDETPLMYFDAAAPGLDTTPPATLEPFVFNDLSSTTIPVNYNGVNFQTNGSLGVLLLHLHNGAGVRSDVVAFRKPTISNFSPTSGPVGALITITGTNFGPGTTVKFFFNKTASINVISSTTIIATVPAGAVSGPITVSNAAGTSVRPGFTVIP